MKSFKTSSVLSFLIVLALLLPACAGANIAEGQVYALQTGTSLWVMRQAIAEKAGTMIMQKDGLVMFMASIDNGWAFVVVDGKSQAVINSLRQLGITGSFVAPKTMSDLATFLQKNGWDIGTAGAVSSVLRVAIISTVSALTQAASSFTTFVVMAPGASFPGTLEGYGTVQQ